MQRVAWLGYRDSGMTGWEQNTHDGAFHSADLDEAAGRLAAILDEEHADILVGYDWHGGYGHPDHVRSTPSSTAPPSSPPGGHASSTRR